MRKEKSNIEKVRQAIKDNRIMIQSFTGMSNEDYDHLFFNTAVQWAESHVCNPDHDVVRLTSQSLFWGWWAVEWNKGNEAFLEAVRIAKNGRLFLILKSEKRERKDYRPEAIQKHYVKYIIHRMLKSSANRVIMEESFHRAIKEEVRK